MSKKNTRIAVINKDKCKPNKCNFECGLICPVNRQKKECIKIIDIEDISKKRIASIVEDACIGCGLCTKPASQGGCPFGAVSIVNVPTELSSDIINRYGKNGFRLYRMPILKQGKILGFIGQNGIGKTTVVQILTGRIKPNFEDFDVLYTPDSIINKFKGNEMHKYMTKLYNSELKISVKPQHVESLVSYIKSKNLDYTVEEYLKIRSVNETKVKKIIEDLELGSILASKVLHLSGGELQRLLCAITLATDADVYIFDEPTNYLDVRQRLNVAKLIRDLIDNDKYIAVIEHDLSILDYISDYICILYGVPGAYGIVSHPLSTSNGINTYFDGYIPGENMRFRQNEYNISLNTSENTGIVYDKSVIKYEGGKIVYPNYELHIDSGYIPKEGSINVIMGKNGTGKTTFIKHIAEQLKSSISYKPQYLSVERFKNSDDTYPTVMEFLMNNIKNSYINDMFRSDVMRPLSIDSISERHLNELSGGEMQRFWLVYCLGLDAQIYLLDEPSACLDIEQRVIITKVIKRFVMHNRKVAFIVEHDMMMAVSLGCEENSQSIFIEQTNSDNNVRINHAPNPINFKEGINNFLKSLEITFHTQSKTSHSRPRINKQNSVKDREQKNAGNYYF